LGFFDFLKGHDNHERMRKIRESGRFGEEQFRNDNAFSDIKKRHHGRDFDKTVTDYQGRKRTERWEVKRNSSPLSEKQKKTRGLKVRRYVDTKYGFVESRTEDKNGNRLEQDVFSGKWKKAKKHQDNLDNMFGAGSSGKQKKTGSGFDDMFDFGSSSRRKRKQDGFDSMFGLGSSSSRKRKKSGYDDLFGF
jgi:hypothetical protein